MTSDPAVNAPYVPTGNLPLAEHVRLWCMRPMSASGPTPRASCHTCIRRWRLSTLTGLASVWRILEVLLPTRVMQTSSSRS